MPFNRYNKKEGLIELRRLVDKFNANINRYMSSTYDEADTRQDLIEPLFISLGWDVHNEQNLSPDIKEVKYEGRVRVHEHGRETIKNPDYVFRYGLKTFFFVEVKPPHRAIPDSDSAFQLRRYAWSKGLPISILTNFKNLCVYDTRFEPHKKDDPRKALVCEIPYTQYIKKFDYLWNTFSYESAITGAFDKYAEETKGKRGHVKVNDAFLAEIEHFREMLARNIALRNRDLNLSVHQINSCVQRTIDRIIFLRVCEDRDIEQYANLKIIAEGGEGIYSRLLKYFEQAEGKYNAGLFNLGEDEMTKSLKIDDSKLKEIIASLYYPDSPYAFDAIPVEILGQVYEQFLGKTIRLTPSGQAKIDYKPEVRKAGGIYYTPKYIVDYIVENTVGRLLEGKTIRQARKIRILDPACGSGSFLLGAYEYLLRWYLQRYTEEAKRYEGKKIYRTSEDEWRLTLEERKRIVMEHIYGVDIDEQAVEVTKLSLHLKVLEGETAETLNGQLRLISEPALPNLGKNIRCGNSLIGPDFYRQYDIGLFSDDEIRRINVFDWYDDEKGFGEIMRDGGFDAVIGNPPYLRVQLLNELQPNSIEYYRNNYKAAEYGNFDIYVIFIEKGYNLINRDGIFGMIVPHKFLNAKFGRGIREIIKEKKSLLKLVHFREFQIFKDSSVYTCLLFMNKENNDNFEFVSFKSGKNIFDSLEEEKKYNISKYFVKSNIKHPSISKKWILIHEEDEGVIYKINEQDKLLDDVTRKIFVGLQTSADIVYVLKRIKNDSKEYITCYSRSIESEVKIERELLKPFLLGKDLKRYKIPKFSNYVLFPYKIMNDRAELIGVDELKEKYPYGWNYILKNKKTLENREKGKMKVKDFYKYIYPKNLNEFENKKIMFTDISLYPNMTYDYNGDLYHTTTIYSLIFKRNIKESDFYFLGILNSKILDFYIRKTGTTLRGGYYRYKTEYLKTFPIRTIDFNNPSDVKMHDEMVKLVERMMDLKRRYHETDDERLRTQLDHAINATDSAIDALVYRLYGLTDEEIRIVEGGV